jgi:hypothetical protein
MHSENILIERGRILSVISVKKNARKIIRIVENIKDDTVDEY